MSQDMKMLTYKQDVWGSIILRSTFIYRLKEFMCNQIN